MEENPPLPKAPVTDVYVTLLFHMFMTNIFFTLGAILLAAIPYYDYFGMYTTREGLLVSGVCAIVFYILFFLSVSYERINLLIGMGFVWWISFSLFVGFISASIYNISLIQWLLISWAQSVALIVYIKKAKIDWYVAGVILFCTTLVVWSISIYGFVVENDWIMSGIILGMSFVMIGYNIWQMMHIKENNSGISWEQRVLVCARYYCPLH